MRAELSTLEASRIAAFCITVIELCIEHSASVEAWYRTRERNRRLGGPLDSYHLEALAVELMPDDPKRLNALAGDARTLGLDAEVERDRVRLELAYRRRLNGTISA